MAIDRNQVYEVLVEIEKYLLKELQSADHVFCSPDCEVNKLLVKVHSLIKTYVVLH